jgi:hypothetical protein
MKIDQNRLKELLDYDPETGIFTRLASGERPGCIDAVGYKRIRVDGEQYLGHRLAFLWMTGQCPAEIDHINRHRSDNRWANLRAANRTQNNANASDRKDNTSGYRGVYWHPRAKKWAATIRINGKRKYLGYFSDIAEAGKAYAAAAEKRLDTVFSLDSKFKEALENDA